MRLEEYTTGEIRDLLLDIAAQLAKIEDKHEDYELQIEWVKLRKLQDYCYDILRARQGEKSSETTYFF